MTPETLLAALNQCVRCGRCLAVCPVYRQTGWEGSVARGKLALLRAELAGEADLGRRMKDLLSHCLLCGACAEACASGVKADELIQAGRALALAGGGLNRLKSLLLRDLLARGLLARGLFKSRGLFLENVPPESGLHFRFPWPGLDRDRWLPPLAPKPFLADLPERHPQDSPGPRVALFVGCVSNYLRPQAARAAVRLLEAAGARVIIPPEQVCCGKPAAAAGDRDTALYLARKNLEVFNPADFDYLTAFCATCSAQLKEYPSFNQPDRPAAWSGRVLDFSELLIKILDWRPSARIEPAPDGPLRVFFHDPCHLRRKQGVWQEPRRLVERLPGVQLVGADAPPVCCGSGGVFNLWHYALSLDLFRTRIEAVKPYDPDLVVTSCSGCLLQFEDGLRRLGRPWPITSLTELLAERGLFPSGL